MKRIPYTRFSPLMASALVAMLVSAGLSQGLAQGLAQDAGLAQDVASGSALERQRTVPAPGHLTASSTLSELVAAGTIKGVGTMGYGAPAQAAPPGSSHGSAPRDFDRGYEGHMPGGDPWNRDADFKARTYQQRHGEEPQYARPPHRMQGAMPGSGALSRPGAGIDTGLDSGPDAMPSLSKPPLPGDRDIPSDSPSPMMR